MKVIKIVCETEYKFESFLAPSASFNKSVIQALASKFATTYKWYMCSSSKLEKEHIYQLYVVAYFDARG